MKRILAILIAAFFIPSILSGCTLSSEHTAARDLRGLLSVDFSLIKSENSKDCRIYTYRDENGVVFRYTSSMQEFGMDGATFFELPRSSTDYPNAAIDHNKAAITELCENSGLHYEYDESSYGKVRLYVNSRGEADTAAKLVSDIFSVQGGIHIKNENSSLCPNRPSVNVYFSGSELCLINFPYDGEQPPLRDVLAEQFLFYHASEIRRGYAICDLTEEELESIPAKYLYMTYNGIESNEFYFFYSTDDGKYYMEISDILPTDGIYMGLVQFNALCDAFGIEYEETSDRMIWYVGKDKFYAVLSEDNEHVTVLKNGTPCCRIELYYSSTRDNTYLCRVTPDELAIMLNAVYTSNNTLGRVVYSHNEP